MNQRLFKKKSLIGLLLVVFFIAVVVIGVLISKDSVKNSEQKTLKFDFGSGKSPVSSGYTKVSNKMAYTASRGYGLNKSVDFQDRGAPDDIKGDFIIGSDYSFMIDLPNGDYNVKIITGDYIESNRTTVVVEDINLGSLISPAGKFVERTIDVRVSDGQMNFHFREDGRVNSIEIIPLITVPKGLAIKNKVFTPAPTISLRWSGVEQAALYNIYRLAEGEKEFTKLASSSTSEFKDDTVELGYNYKYKISAVSSTNVESAMTDEIEIAVMNKIVAVPAAPTGVLIGGMTESSASFNWKTVDNAIHYNIYRSKSENGQYMRIATTANTSYTDPTISTHLNYYYKIAAVNEGGISEKSKALMSPIERKLLRQAEYLDRGIVAIPTSDGILISWRLLGTEPEDISFNLYRNGVKINSSPIDTSTNYLDIHGNNNSIYYVKAVINNIEQSKSEEAKVWGNSYLDIPIQRPTGGRTPTGEAYVYHANDASVADLDGDGKYEIILKWDPSNSKDNSQKGYTGNVYVDAYKLDGTLLWRIDLGRNIRAGAHYTQFLVYDLDGDGRAEVAVKTADGTIDGKGKVIGDANADYRNSDGYVLSGPEYLTIFDGLTGAELVTTEYDPPRENVGSWGDTYGNRVDRFLAAIAYLDGERPSLVMCRGYYTRSVLVAYNWRDGKLTKLWAFDSNDAGNSGYAGQGNHSLSIGDIDDDGYDEIIYGACVIDHNGKGLNTTKLGHGDANHLSDFDPDRPGLEYFQVHENTASPYGYELRDPVTGEVIFGVKTGRDTGRGLIADIDPRYRGAEFWASGGAVHAITGDRISNTMPRINFAIWWDGDLLREILDHDWNGSTGVGMIYKWDYQNSRMVPMLRADGTYSNNGTKGTPALQADLFGDWREEVIWRTEDSSALRIYSTPYVTEHRMPTLMHDPIYRLSIAWQNVAYNQPPHTSYFLGHEMDAPPTPRIYIAGPSGAAAN